MGTDQETGAMHVLGSAGQREMERVFLGSEHEVCGRAGAGMNRGGAHGASGLHRLLQ